MNCSLCLGYQREKNTCPGCNGPNENIPKYCVTCRIKNCEHLSQTASDFCFSCDKFPCKRLKQLDARYRKKYGMSMLQNLKTIEAEGMRNLVKMQTTKWTCKKCGSLLCVHREKCLICGSKNTAFPGKILKKSSSKKL